MASASTFTPKKSISETDIFDLKWPKKVSRLYHQPSIKTRRVTDIPADDSSKKAKLTDPNQVLFVKQESKSDSLKFTILNLHQGSNKGKAPVVEEQARVENPNPEINADAVVAAALAAQEEEKLMTKTWNLRPRKPRKPVRNPNRGESAQSEQTNEPRLRPPRPARVPQSKKPPEPRKEISLTLTKEEIEEDFLRMTGKKPARLPKTREKKVQKQLNIIVPGLLHLDDIIAHDREQAKLDKGSD